MSVIKGSRGALSSAMQRTKRVITTNNSVSLFLTLAIYAALLVSVNHGEVGRDGMPVLVGARQILLGENPYAPEQQQVIRSLFDAPGVTRCGEGSCASIGLVYPATSLLVALPFAAIPIAIESALLGYTLFGLALILIGARLNNIPYLLLAIFVPVTHGFGVANVLIVATGLLLVATKIPDGWLKALALIAAVAIKPHSTILISAFLALPMLKHRTGWLQIGVPSVALLLLAEVALPGWWSDWISQMQLYREVETFGNQSVAHFWWLVPVAGLLWHRGHGLASAVLAQVLLVPAIALPCGFATLALALVGLERNRVDVAVFGMMWGVIGMIWFMAGVAAGVSAQVATLAAIVLPILIYWMIQTYPRRADTKEVSQWMTRFFP